MPKLSVEQIRQAYVDYGGDPFKVRRVSLTSPFGLRDYRRACLRRRPELRSLRFDFVVAGWNRVRPARWVDLVSDFVRYWDVTQPRPGRIHSCYNDNLVHCMDAFLARIPADDYPLGWAHQLGRRPTPRRVRVVCHIGRRWKGNQHLPFPPMRTRTMERLVRYPKSFGAFMRECELLLGTSVIDDDGGLGETFDVVSDLWKKLSRESLQALRLSAQTWTNATDLVDDDEIKILVNLVDQGMDADQARDVYRTMTEVMGS